MELITKPRIKTRDAIELFDGVKYRLAQALGINRQAIDYWGEYAPDKQARKIYEMFPDKFRSADDDR